MKLLIFALLALGLAAGAPRAEAPAPAAVSALAQDPTWLKLLHYKGRTGRLHSDVLDDGFFLAADGRHDPAAELAATMQALTAPVAGNADQHGQCRFPARFQWLKAHLADTAFPQIECRAYRRWLDHDQIGGVSLVFVSGNLASPASFFGHLLLKFDAAKGAGPSEGLLDSSLNYGANFPSGEPAPLYLMRGLAGGYHSNFTNLTFYNQNNRYAETELRDVWEYELNLDRSQVDMLVAHSWELMGRSNRYFFLKQNCAYRMAELVELVIDEPLLPRTKPWAMPTDVFVRLSAVRLGDRPLVRSVRRRPSRQTQFREELAALGPDGQGAVRQFVGEVDGGGQGDLDGAEAPVIETLIDYYSLAELKSKAEALADARRVRDRLLLARMRLPVTPDTPARSEPAPPHLGQRSSMLQAAVLANDELGEGVELRFRGAFNDFLTYSPGALPNSELTLVDVRVVDREQHVDLRMFEIARVTALKLSPTGLPKDGGRAWRMRFGAEARDLGCSRCLVGFLEGGMGKAVRLGGDTAAYAFGNARVEGGGSQEATLHAGASAGLLFGGPRIWRGNLEGGVWRELDGLSETYSYLKLEIRIGTSSRWDVRAGAVYQHKEAFDVFEPRLALSYYW